MIIGSVTLDIQFSGVKSPKIGASKPSGSTKDLQTTNSFNSNAILPDIKVTSKSKIIGVGVKTTPVSRSSAIIPKSSDYTDTVYLLSVLGKVLPYKMVGCKKSLVGTTVVKSGQSIEVRTKTIIKYSGFKTTKIGKTKAVYSADYININPPDFYNANSYNSNLQSNQPLDSFNRYQISRISTSLKPTKVGTATYKTVGLYGSNYTTINQSNQTLDSFTKYQLNNLYKTPIVFAGFKLPKIGSAKFNVGNFYTGYQSAYLQAKATFDIITKYQLNNLYKTPIVFAGFKSPKIGKCIARFDNLTAGFVSNYTQTNIGAQYYTDYQAANAYKTNIIFNCAVSSIIGSAIYPIFNYATTTYVYNSYESRYTQLNIPVIKAYVGFQHHSIGIAVYPIIKTASTTYVYGGINTSTYTQSNIPVIKAYVGTHRPIIGTAIYPIIKTASTTYVYGGNNTSAYTQSNVAVIKEYVGLISINTGVAIYPVIKTRNTTFVYYDTSSKYIQTNTDIIKNYVGIRYVPIGATKASYPDKTRYVDSTGIPALLSEKAADFVAPLKHLVGVTRDNYPSSFIPVLSTGSSSDIIANITSKFAGYIRSSRTFRCWYPPSLLYTRPYNDPSLSPKPNAYVGKKIGASIGALVLYSRINILPIEGIGTVVPIRIGDAGKANFVGSIVPRNGVAQLYDKVFPDLLPTEPKANPFLLIGRVKFAGKKLIRIGKLSDARFIEGDNVPTSIVNIQLSKPSAAHFIGVLAAIPGKSDSREIILGLSQYTYSYEPPYITSNLAGRVKFTGIKKHIIGSAIYNTDGYSAVQTYSYEPPFKSSNEAGRAKFIGCLIAQITSIIPNNQPDHSDSPYYTTESTVQRNVGGVGGFYGCMTPKIGTGWPGINLDPTETVYKIIYFFDQNTKPEHIKFVSYYLPPVGLTKDKIIDNNISTGEYSYTIPFKNDFSRVYGLCSGIPSISIGNAVGGFGSYIVSTADTYLQTRVPVVNGYTGILNNATLSVKNSDIIIPVENQEYYFYIRDILLDSAIRTIQSRIIPELVAEYGSILPATIGNIIAPSVQLELVNKFNASIQTRYSLTIPADCITILPLNSGVVADYNSVSDWLPTIRIQSNILRTTSISSGSGVYNTAVGSTIGGDAYWWYNTYRLIQTNVLSNPSGSVGYIPTRIGQAIAPVTIYGEFKNTIQDNIVPTIISDGVGCTAVYIGHALAQAEFVGNIVDNTQFNITPTIINSGIGINNVYIGHTIAQAEFVSALVDNTQLNIIPSVITIGNGTNNVYIGHAIGRAEFVSTLVDNTQLNIIPSSITIGNGTNNVYIGHAIGRVEFVSTLVDNTQLNIIPSSITAGVGINNVYIGHAIGRAEFVSTLVDNTQLNIIPNIITFGVGIRSNNYIGGAIAKVINIGNINIDNIQLNIVPDVISNFTGILTNLISFTKSEFAVNIGSINTNSIQDKLPPNIIHDGGGLITASVGGAIANVINISDDFVNITQFNQIPPVITSGIGIIPQYIGNTDIKVDIIGDITNNIQNTITPTVVTFGVGFINKAIGYTESYLIENIGELTDHYIQINDRLTPIEFGVGVIANAVGYGSSYLIEETEVLSDQYIQINDRLTPIEFGVGVIANAVGYGSCDLIENIGELTDHYIQINDRLTPIEFGVGVIANAVGYGSSYLIEETEALSDQYLQINDRLTPIEFGVGVIANAVGYGSSYLIEETEVLLDQYIQINDRLTPIEFGVGVIANAVGYGSSYLIEETEVLSDQYIQINDRLTPIEFGVGILSNNIGVAECLIVTTFDIDSSVDQTQEISNITFGVGVTTHSIGTFEVYIPITPDTSWKYPEHPENIIFDSVLPITYGVLHDKYSNVYTLQPIEQQLGSIGVSPDLLNFNSVGWRNTVVITNPQQKPFKLFQYWS